jgi:hypothetical protein
LHPGCGEVGREDEAAAVEASADTLAYLVDLFRGDTLGSQEAKVILQVFDQGALAVLLEGIGDPDLCQFDLAD